MVEAFFLLVTYYINECSSAKAGQVMMRMMMLMMMIMIMMMKMIRVPSPSTPTSSPSSASCSQRTCPTTGPCVGMFC